MALRSATIPTTSADTLKGIAILMAAFAIFPCLDATGKALIEWHGISAGMVALVRQVLQVAMILPFMLWRNGGRAFRTGHVGLNLLRGVLIGLGAIAFFGALGLMPLADATAVFMVQPMMITLLAVPFLGERIGWRRIAAIFVGFAGAMLIVQPSYAVFGLASLLPVLAAFLVGLYLIASRFVSPTTDPLAMIFYAGLSGTVVVALAMAAGAQAGFGMLAFTWPVRAETYALFVLLGAIGTLGHLLVVEAYARAPASVLAPFGYLELVTAILLGYLVFGDWPDALKWLGMAIVVGSGLAIYGLERRAARNAPRVGPAP